MSAQIEPIVSLRQGGLKDARYPQNTDAFRLPHAPPPAVAGAMTHLDTSMEPRLERMLSEIRTHHKQLAALEMSKAPPGFSELG